MPIYSLLQRGFLVTFVPTNVMARERLLSVTSSTPLRMTSREFDALRDIVNHQTGTAARRVSPFFRRQAAMRKLAAQGLVEPMPGYGTASMKAWRATDAGHQRIAKVKRTGTLEGHA